MPKRSTVYSADAITFSMAGLPIDSGRGTDEFLRIEQEEDDFTYTAGVDGEGVFNHKMNKFTTITLTLLQTAKGNDVLSALHQASMLAGGLPSPVFMEDRKGNSKLVSDAAIIKKMPDETFGGEADTTEWVIGVHDPVRFVGGH